MRPCVPKITCAIHMFTVIVTCPRRVNLASIVYMRRQQTLGTPFMSTIGNLLEHSAQPNLSPCRLERKHLHKNLVLPSYGGRSRTPPLIRAPLNRKRHRNVRTAV